MHTDDPEEMLLACEVGALLPVALRELLTPGAEELSPGEQAILAFLRSVHDSGELDFTALAGVLGCHRTTASRNALLLLLRLARSRGVLPRGRGEVSYDTFVDSLVVHTVCRDPRRPTP